MTMQKIIIDALVPGRYTDMLVGCLLNWTFRKEGDVDGNIVLVALNMEDGSGSRHVLGPVQYDPIGRTMIDPPIHWEEVTTDLPYFSTSDEEAKKAINSWPQITDWSVDTSVPNEILITLEFGLDTIGAREKTFPMAVCRALLRADARGYLRGV